jgi:hypothetical protein
LEAVREQQEGNSEDNQTGGGGLRDGRRSKLRRIEKKGLLLTIEGTGSDDVPLVVDPVGRLENPAGVGWKQRVQIDHLAI